MYTFIYIYIYICINIYIYIYTSIYLYIYIYISKWPPSQEGSPVAWLEDCKAPLSNTL